jgi:hypothetical protein
MDAHAKVRLKTMKETMRMWDEEYGRSHAKPPLKQVVPGKYYRRRDHSHIRCTRCHTWLRADERDHYSGQCTKCSDYLATRPYPKQNEQQHNKSMAKGMVLANSCNYERWS